MRTIAAFVRVTAVWASLTFVASGHGAETETLGPRVQRWGGVELTLDGPDEDNAYVDVRFAATFQGDEQKITVPGFYDGNGKYKVRFNPPNLGRWTFTTESDRAAADHVCRSRPPLSGHGRQPGEP